MFEFIESMIAYVAYVINGLNEIGMLDDFIAVAVILTIVAILMVTVVYRFEEDFNIRNKKELKN